MLNRIVLVGRLTKDPESQYTPSGIAVARFRIAVDRDFRNKETGEKETDFINVVAWRRTAEFVSQYVTKGRLVAVDGRLQIREWTGQDNIKRREAEVVADNINTLDRARDAEGGFEGGREDSGQPRVASPSAGADDELDPFAEE
jgi:single-strand DNA-binding protein